MVRRNRCPVVLSFVAGFVSCFLLNAWLDYDPQGPARAPAPAAFAASGALAAGMVSAPEEHRSMHDGAHPLNARLQPYVNGFQGPGWYCITCLTWYGDACTGEAEDVQTGCVHIDNQFSWNCYMFGIRQQAPERAFSFIYTTNGVRHDRETLCDPDDYLSSVTSSTVISHAR